MPDISEAIRYGQPQTIAAAISGLVQAIANCKRSGNAEWLDKHSANLDQLERELPSGSGIDSGTQIDRDKTTADRIVLTFGYHFMDDSGSYGGWLDYTAIIQPTFTGLDVTIKGRNRNDIKDYLNDVYHHVLSTIVRHRYDVASDSSSYEYVKGN